MAVPKSSSMRLGFEPTGAEHIGLAVQHLNHSATSSYTNNETNKKFIHCTLMFSLSIAAQD
jgi:hypothetical protein